MGTGGTNGLLPHNGSTEVGDWECAKHQISKATRVCHRGTVLVLRQDVQDRCEQKIVARVYSHGIGAAASSEAKP